MNDVRYACRLLRRDLGYAAVAILTMAVGIGATTTLFSVAYGVLLKPLPWADGDRLVRITESRKGQQARLPGTISNGAYLAWRDQASTVEAISGYGLGGDAMTAIANGGEPTRLQVGRLTASMFDVLRARPLRGRAFTADDERDDSGADLFIAHRQFPDWWTRGSIIFVVRTTDDPHAHVQALRTAVREQDPTAALDSIMTMEERVASSLAMPRLYAVLLVSFAVAALAIAAVGLFGLLSYVVAQRSREIGIRTALGAQTPDILALVLRQGTAISISGIAAGLCAAYVLTRYLSSFIYGVDRADVASYITVACAVGLVATIASIVPAWRAARIDPLIALRAE